MDKLKFDLNELLRHFFAGTVVIAGLLFGYRNFMQNLEDPHGLQGAVLATAWLTGVVTLGTLIYVIHRAVPYRLIRGFIVSRVWAKECGDLRTSCKPPKTWLSAVREMTTKTDIERLARLTKNEKSIVHQFNAWGSQVHFLYCSAYAVLVSWVAGSAAFMELKPRNYADWYFCFGFVCLFLFAFIHNYQLEEFGKLVAQREAAEPEIWEVFGKSHPKGRACNEPQ